MPFERRYDKYLDPSFFQHRVRYFAHFDFLCNVLKNNKAWNKLQKSFNVTAYWLELDFCFTFFTNYMYMYVWIENNLKAIQWDQLKTARETLHVKRYTQFFELEIMAHACISNFSYHEETNLTCFYISFACFWLALQYTSDVSVFYEVCFIAFMYVIHSHCSPFLFRSTGFQSLTHSWWLFSLLVLSLWF